MVTIKSFEDLICWQKARLLTKFIYKITKETALAKDFGLVDQIRRASLSIMSNIAEGFDRGTRQEFLNYLFIAKGSCGEVRSELYVAYDAQYIDFETLRKGLRLTEEVSRLLSSFISKVKVGAQPGLQYKKETKDILGELLNEFNIQLPKYD